MHNGYVENNFLGLLKGSTGVDSAWDSGVRGHFYYQNHQLFGLDDDTPDNIMGGSDGLADISSYLTNNTTHLSWKLVWEKHTNFIYNIYSGFFLTYTTPCDTFSVSVSNDTTICAGETVQLHASGGNTSLSKPAYEWRPHKNLSCYNCANPIFSGDSSQVYTVRIWNTDSCSKVLPVRVKVLPVPTFSKITTTQSECGNATGAIIAISEGSADSLFLDNNFVGLAPQTLQNMGGGNYTLFLKDTNGCKSADTVVIVPSTITTIANFTAQPTHGSAPLQVSLTNISQNATDYSWWLNGTYQGNNFSGFLADTSGTYHIQLIAWNNDSLCADTASLTVWVYDSLVTRIPNVFTPNGDGVNDYFTITVNLPVKTKLVILNRWGNVVHEWEGKLHKGQNVLWNGSSSGSFSDTQNTKVSDGTYFYKLVFSDLPGKEKTRKATGYVEVLR